MEIEQRIMWVWPCLHHFSLCPSLLLGHTSAVLNDTETVNTMLMDTGFTEMCSAANAQPCVQLQTCSQTRILNWCRYWQRCNQKERQCCKWGRYSDTGGEEHVRDGWLEKERQTEAQRSLVLHCNALAPGRVRGWNGLLAAAGGDDISGRPKGRVKTSQVHV